MQLDTAQRELISTSDITALVWGRGGEFEIVRLGQTDPDLLGRVDRALDRGLEFVGVLGFRDGLPEARIATGNPGAVYTMMFAGAAFAHDIVAYMNRPKGDEMAWLNSLYELADTRPN